MNRDEIQDLLPHREPMLLLDDVTVEQGEAVGHLHIRGDEFFVQGHFPGNPVVPGVMLCEMLAQNCCVLLGDDMSREGTVPFYTSLDKVRFRHPVKPGDTVELRCHITRERGAFHFAHGEASVAGVLCCSAEMSFALVRTEAGSASEER